MNEFEKSLPPSRKNVGERRVYQYATGRGGVPIGNESPMGLYDEYRDYQYATGRGGIPLSREDIRNYRKQFSETKHYGKGPKGWSMSDEDLKDYVCEALYRSYDVDASDIEVDVADGVVTLKGEVDNREIKKLAEDVVDSVDGVKDVENRLSFKRDEPKIGHTH